MPSRKDPKLLLEDILENTGRIERYVAGLTEESFTLDEQTMDAVERNLQRISEAAIRLGPEAETLCPGLPWADIRGMDNILRHGYDHVKPGIIWNTVRRDLGPLQVSVHAAVIRLEEREGPGGPEPG